MLLKILAPWVLLACHVAAQSKPNVLLIMTDDQDMLLDSMSVMPNVNKLIGEQGVQYDKHYCTVAWCCPSRVNLLTGKAAHNTNVTTLRLPHGGWMKFVQEKLHHNYLPVWIKKAGLRTYYVGKLLNDYKGENWDKPYPKGWTKSTFLVDPWTYDYHNSTWTNGNSENGLTAFPGEHTTFITQQKAIDFINDAADSEEQFFMMVTPVAPHAEQKKWRAPPSPPPPPEEFENSFNDNISPRTPNFNPDDASGASWVYNMPQLTPAQVDRGDDFHRHRLRNIAGVDLMVAALIQTLEDRGLLDNTYIIYTSDNGFHIGNHRLHPGKRCGYEEDINIPLLIRGPGVPRNVTTQVTNSHTDIAPTVLSMLGLSLRDDFDGEPIPITQADLADTTKYEHVNVEFWDSPVLTPGDMTTTNGSPAGSYYNNTYKSLRINSAGQSFYYSVWCTGDKELYDMKADQYQMKNLLRPVNGPLEDIRFFGRSFDRLVDRLDALLMVLKSCKQDSCRDPYGVLFPKRQVLNLTAAMDEKYDEYFRKAPKVEFVTCFSGHIEELEGPMKIKAFGAGSCLAQSMSTITLLGFVWFFWYAASP